MWNWKAKEMKGDWLREIDRWQEQQRTGAYTGSVGACYIH